ncbi:MAG: YdcF family protein [Lachnospiraceae bacterium]|nr:YdcF family protein [Lachnospiraceae bacterium]
MTVRILLTGLGILSILYFFEYVLLIGLNNSFLLVWPAFGIFCLAWGCLHDVIRKKELVRLIFLEKVMTGICGVFLLAVLVTLLIIIRAGFERPEKGADYLVILGAHVYGERMSSNLRYRVEIGKKYLEENPETKVILSGGKGFGEDITEAEAMRRYLVEKGISEKRILVEDQSVNTDENIRYSRKLMEDEKEAFVVIATNRFHLFRAEGIAKKQGLEKVQGIGQYIRPDTAPNAYLREVIAIWKYKLCGQI